MSRGLNKTHQRCITELEKKLHLAKDYIDQLENCHCQSNVRPLNVPELQENKGVQLLDKEWNVKLEEDHLESAHHLGPIKCTFPPYHYLETVSPSGETTDP